MTICWKRTKSRIATRRSPHGYGETGTKRIRDFYSLSPFKRRNRWVGSGQVSRTRRPSLDGNLVNDADFGASFGR